MENPSKVGFPSSTEYDALKKKEGSLIVFIVMLPFRVKKTVMAPNLFSKSNKITKKYKIRNKMSKNNF